jgi:hypothetical protein
MVFSPPLGVGPGVGAPVGPDLMEKYSLWVFLTQEPLRNPGYFKGIIEIGSFCSCSKSGHRVLGGPTARPKTRPPLSMEKVWRGRSAF